MSPLKLEDKCISLVDAVTKMRAEIVIPDAEILESVLKFNVVYYTQYPRTWSNTFYHGIYTCQSVADLWIYQELIFDRKPDLIIETGTGFGGCALYFAHLLDNMEIDGKVISIDIQNRASLEHPKITYLTGESLSDPVMSRVEKETGMAKEVMVFLDSSHKEDYVYEEIKTYSKFVKLGGYLVVEDTNVQGPVLACDRFIADSGEFEIDPACNKFYLTFNPGGFLRRIKETPAVNIAVEEVATTAERTR